MMFSLTPIVHQISIDHGLREHPVVAWKEAADSHDSVASDALVMPMISGRPSAGRRALLDHVTVRVAEALRVDPLARQEVSVTRLLDTDAAGLWRTISSMSCRRIDTPWSR